MYYIMKKIFLVMIDSFGGLDRVNNFLLILNIFIINNKILMVMECCVGESVEVVVKVIIKKVVEEVYYVEML